MSAFDTFPEKTTQPDAGVLYRRGPVSGFVTPTRVNEPGHTLWVKLGLRR